MDVIRHVHMVVIRVVIPPVKRPVCIPVLEVVVMAAVLVVQVRVLEVAVHPALEAVLGVVQVLLKETAILVEVNVQHLVKGVVKVLVLLDVPAAVLQVAKILVKAVVKVLVLLGVLANVIQDVKVRAIQDVILHVKEAAWAHVLGIVGIIVVMDAQTLVVAHV